MRDVEFKFLFALRWFYRKMAYSSLPFYDTPYSLVLQ